MHLHLVKVVARPHALRPAKVVSLEVRRKARLQRPRPTRPAKPAA
jgi:hypothetical protein